MHMHLILGVYLTIYGTHALIKFSVIVGEQYETPPSADLQFPLIDDLINYTHSDNISTIKIPPSVIQERLNMVENNGKLQFMVPHVSILHVQNLCFPKFVGIVYNGLHCTVPN